MNLFLGALVLVLLVAYLRWVSPVRLLHRLDARPMDKGPVFRNVIELAGRIARRQRVPAPSLWVLPEFSPNALVLRPGGKNVYIALTEGLVRALSGEELEAALALCLAHGNQKGRTRQTWVAAFFFPLAKMVQGYPLPAQLLLSPVLSFTLRLAVRPSQFFLADEGAAQFSTGWRVAAVLQKLSVMARKIPLGRWNLALDSLFLVSPLTLEETPLWSFLAQPSVDRRRENLLRSAACERAPSLT